MENLLDSNEFFIIAGEKKLFKEGYLNGLLLKLGYLSTHSWFIILLFVYCQDDELYSPKGIQLCLEY